MKTLLSIAIPLTVLYAAFAFIGMQPNPALWTSGGRFFFILIAALILGWLKAIKQI